MIDFADGIAYSLENGEWVPHNDEAVLVKSNEENVKIEYKGLDGAITRNIVKECKCFWEIWIRNRNYIDKPLKENQRF